jgi:SAM-dependent methyltransferase
MRALLAKLKAPTVELNYGREVIAAMARRYARRTAEGELNILDIGLGTGADLLNVAKSLGHPHAKLFGLESHAPHVEAARALGVEVRQADVERSAFPFEPASLDLILANQVLEHTKEIFWIASEVSRVLKPGGLFIVGVPNLASLHSRIMLGLGMQPSPIDVLGPHVRGFTKPGFRRFIETDGYFRVVEVGGSNFYPFPQSLARPLARLLPAFAVSLFFCCQRTGKAGRFLDVLESRFFETPYYRGDPSR